MMLFNKAGILRLLHAFSVKADLATRDCLWEDNVRGHKDTDILHQLLGISKTHPDTVRRRIVDDIVSTKMIRDLHSL